MNTTLHTTTITRTNERAIVHVNGESLYASIEQSLHKKYQSKVLVVVNVQGKILSVSQEAKKIGIAITMDYKELKRMYPQAIILIRARTDYSSYKRKIEKILRKYTQEIDEYSPGSYFADLTGLQTLRKMKYKEMAEKIVSDVYSNLRIYIPVAISTSRVLAHMGSMQSSSNTLVVVDGKNSSKLLKGFFVEEIWNISSETIAYLNKLRIYSAYDLVKLPSATVEKVFQISIIELWKELRGTSIWHDMATSSNDIDYRLSLLRSCSLKQKQSRVSPFSLTDTFERLYQRITGGVESSMSLQVFDERVKRHLIVPYIGKVS